LQHKSVGEFLEHCNFVFIVTKTEKVAISGLLGIPNLDIFRTFKNVHFQIPWTFENEKNDENGFVSIML